MLNELADPPLPYTRIARARAELETLREQAADAVVEADQLEAQAASLGLDPTSAAWLTGRFERFIATLRAESDALLDHTAASPGPAPTAATVAAVPAALESTPAETTASQPVPAAGLDAPAALPGLVDSARAPIPVTQPAAEHPTGDATPAPPELLPIDPPTPSVEAPPEFDRAFWKEDEPPPWSARVTKRLRLSKANAYALGAVIALALAVAIYFS